MSNLRLSYLQKWGGGGYLYRPSPPPPPQKVGGCIPPSPGPPGFTPVPTAVAASYAPGLAKVDSESRPVTSIKTEGEIIMEPRLQSNSHACVQAFKTSASIPCTVPCYYAFIVYCPSIIQPQLSCASRQGEYL